MTALTKDKELLTRAGHEMDVKLAADAVIYNGAMVCANATGYGVPAADTADFDFIGYAIESVDNTGGADGDVSVRVVKAGEILVKHSGLTIANLGQAMFVNDDATVKSSTTNSVYVGRLTELVGTDEAWVNIDKRGATGAAGADGADGADGAAGADGADGADAVEMDNVAAIADPGTATAEDCATKINAILTAMKAADHMVADA